MKFDDLRKNLNQLKIPSEDSVARDRALDRALVALRNRSQEEEPHPARSAGWLIRTFALPVLALAAVLIFALWSGSPKENEAADLQVLNEVAELFPKTLEAVVEHNGEVDVQLASQDVPRSTQPLVLIFKKGREVLRVLSYSGREICLNLEGQRICVEPLAGNDGEVIVAGENFLWSPQNPLLLNGYAVEAKSLSAAL